MDFDNVELVKPTPLLFNPSKLEGFSKEMIDSHWGHNYCDSVNILNDVNKKLKEAFADKGTPNFIISELKREQLMRTGSVVNHDLYFENLGGNGKIDGGIQHVVSQVYGSDNIWEQEFRKIAASLGGGTGWVVLGYNYHLKVLENYWCNDHLHGAPTLIPLLVMDVYEHSYQMDYGAAVAKYIDAFFKNINWDVVNRRFEKLKLFV